MSKSVDEDPDVIVEDAEAKAVEAEALVTAIEDRIVAGDDTVTHADLSEQISVARFARKLVEAAREKAKSIRESKRQVVLSQIRGEMDAHATAEGTRRVELLTNVESAVLAFVSEYASDNAKFSDWRGRMAAAGVKPIGPRFAALASDQGLSYSDSAVRAGTREFQPEYSGLVLQGLLHSLLNSSQLGREYFTADNAGYPTRDELFARVRTVAQEVPGIPEDALFYRHENGQVHMRDTAHAWPAEDLKRLGLTPISREEAIAE
ncbi:hypothetical protein G3T36_17315 [Diaminobutyricibacter tongyongensis]|uniref:Uncharacterized protein n=1 Tax=Leifsonia tongyongensis TaxID=1268043 RepID=A0A6L9Y1P9_9MICO|nr:hypothetical protein [Diaminobutyricibacter tongyongensis]NEN07619.1 hypothetical protein [Diaminobutyricibacter tongyongensis]